MYFWSPSPQVEAGEPFYQTLEPISPLLSLSLSFGSSLTYFTGAGLEQPCGLVESGNAFCMWGNGWLVDISSALCSSNWLAYYHLFWLVYEVCWGSPRGCILRGVPQGIVGWKGFLWETLRFPSSAFCCRGAPADICRNIL